MQMTPNTGGPRFRPYASPGHHVTKGRYITSNDPRGYIPVYEYPLNGQWIMMDIDDGYILWTGIWKALGNSKADIVKMIDSQPDLAQVIRRVRGGYLKIQGTWMPYEVALRLSRRVAWPIKEDLVPLFGPTFPSTCLSPDQPGYGQVVNTGSGRRRARRPATAPNPSPIAPMILPDLRDNPAHPSWTVVTCSQANSHLAGSPTAHHGKIASYDDRQPSYHRASHSHAQQTHGVSDRSPSHASADLDGATPSSSLNTGAAASRERGDRVERPPPSASLRYSPYLGHNSYTQHQHKIGRRSFSSLSRGSGSADGSGSGEISGGGNSPVAVDIPSLAIQELPSSSSRPPLHLALPSLRNGSSALSPTETSPLATSRPSGSFLSRSKSLGQVDKITLPPIRSPGGPLSASAATRGFSPLATENGSMSYALPPISALEDLRGVHAQDSAAVLRRLTVDDEFSSHGPMLSSRSGFPITLEPQPPQLSSCRPSTADRCSHHSQNGSETEHSQCRPDATLSPGGTSPAISPTTPPSAYKDAHHHFGSHAILVRESAEPMHASPRHRVAGVTDGKDGTDEQGTAADMEMDYVAQDVKPTRHPRCADVMDLDLDRAITPPFENATRPTARVPHRPW
ncbi:hypothetical protein APHAL10511_000789 [Amanita phalloides]|nr:hypothetical protein APHAL10511_000789 [Amanita phalloides]